MKHCLPVVAGGFVGLAVAVLMNIAGLLLFVRFYQLILLCDL